MCPTPKEGEKMKTLLPRSLAFACLVVSLLLLAGCSKSPSIVGKWRPVGSDKNEVMEFFVDGKMAFEPNMALGPNGERSLPDYKLSHGKLSVMGGARNINWQNLPMSFSDADHMDLDGSRYERIKEGLTIPAK
jgi:hypothetical protein